MDVSITGKVAIVTNASRGIGKAIALKFAEHGIIVPIASKTVESSPKTPGSILDRVKYLKSQILSFFGKKFHAKTRRRKVYAEK